MVMKFNINNFIELFVLEQREIIREIPRKKNMPTVINVSN